MNIDIDLGADGAVQGAVDPAFEAVADAFLTNFRQRGEVGASVCLNLGGRQVVDLWGGLREAGGTERWQRDTVAIVYSCTKAATALCAQILIDRGLLELDAPIARYWPEFAQAGKADATVRMALNHSVGLPALREPLKPGAYLDWDYMVERLAAEAPFWPPGTANGYHMVSFGWIVGELVRRISGRSLGRFFQDEVAVPLGLDFWIGTPEDIEARIAPTIPFKPDADASKTDFTDFTKALMTDPTSISHLAIFNNGGWRVDSREGHAAEIGGAGGVSNARSLARLFEPLANGGACSAKSGGKSGVMTGSAAGSIRLLSAARIEDMRQVSVETDRDRTLLIPTRFGQGFMLRMDNGPPPAGQSLLLGEQAFGHVGAGGSLVFADVQHHLSFGYTMNRMGDGLLLNERGQALVDAAYGCL